MDTKLTFNKQLTDLTRRAAQRSGCIRRTFKVRDISFQTQMFKAFVLPILESASTIWSPTTIGQAKNLERIQRAFTKYLPGLYDLPYLERCEKAGLQPLIIRRICTDLIFLYKLTSDRLTDLNYSTFFNLTTTENRGHTLKIYRDRTKTKQRSNFVINRIAALWNNLPAEIVEAKSVSSFKGKLQDYIIQPENIINKHILEKYYSVVN